MADSKSGPPSPDPWQHLHSRLDDLPHGALIHVRSAGQEGRYIVAHREADTGHPSLEFIPEEQALRRPSLLRSPEARRPRS